MIVIKTAAAPLGADQVETIVTVWRIVRAQLIKSLRCEARPSCHVLLWLGFCQAAVTFMSSQCGRRTRTVDDYTLNAYEHWSGFETALVPSDIAREHSSEL